MSSSPISAARGPEFRGRPPFPISWYVREYVNFLDSGFFAAIRERVVELTICDRNKLDRVTSAGSWVKQWLSYGDWDSSILALC